MIKTLSTALVTAFIVVVFMLPCPGDARGASGQQTQNTLDEMVVTAGRVAESKKLIAANVTVIDEQEIRQSSASDLGDLLAQKGIGAIKKYPGNLTTIGIRGFRTDSQIGRAHL